MGERRVFSKEFKEEALKLAHTSGRSMTSIAQGIGIDVNMLCLRRRESQRVVTDNNITAFPGHGNIRDEEVAGYGKETPVARYLFMKQYQG